MQTAPKRFLQRCLLGLALFILPSSIKAAIIYVNHAAGGANNGTNWIDAYTSLSMALSAAGPGDEIWVAQGVYKPLIQVDLDGSGGVDAREATFQVPDGVAVYGGFDGSEGSRDERNWSVHITILSGDIDNNDINIDGNSIAENTSQLVGNNAYHVLYTNNVSALTSVDGFVITAGAASGAGPVTDPNRFGGGWYNNLEGVVNASSPSIGNNIFQGNFALSEGGGLYNKNGTVGAAVISQIKNCKFRYNKSDFAGGAVGLGSFSAGNYAPVFLNCEFLENEAFRRGGALYFVGDHAILKDCRFKNNKVTAVAMGVTEPGSGGGVAMTASNARFSKCFFTGNSATGNATGAFEGGGGGAVYMSTNEPQSTSLGASEPEFTGCGFYSNIASGNTSSWGGAAVHLSDGGQLRPSYVNCVFADNQAQNDGGAIANFSRVIGVEEGFVPDLKPVYTNCTFVSNQALQRGGAIFNDGFIFDATEMLQSRIENCILWNDNAAMDGAEVFNTGSNVVAYSFIEGSGGSGAGWNLSIGSDGGNNLDESPAFTNEADPDGTDNIPATNDDGLNLSATSPAVDAGNNTATGLTGVATDYKSAPRIQNGNVDMGAYERGGIIIPDLDFYWLKDWFDKKPPCFICPWAFLLKEKLFQQFIWDGKAQFVINDKSATITGRIVNRDNKKQAFEVYLKLIKKQNWKTWSNKGRTYTATTFEAIQVSKKTHREWTFWELSDESYLKGNGELSGKLNLSHLPVNFKTGFQFGSGANGWDKDLGMSGTFQYSGNIRYNGKKIHLKGKGSMNVDAVKCKEKCSLLHTSDPALAKGDQISETITGKKTITVYPVPASDWLTVSSVDINSEKYLVKVFTSTGQLKNTSLIRASGNTLRFSVSGLQPGMYILHLVSVEGKTMSIKFIKQ